MSPVETAVMFRRAAELIRDGGLVQGDFVDGTAHCIVGALMTVSNEQKDDSNVIPEGRLLATILGKRTLSELIIWNDADERTADDVITLLEQAAEKLEADR